MDLKKISEGLDEQKTAEIAISVVAIGASYLLRKLMEAGYEEIYDENPPNEVDGRKINWGKLAGWTIVSGLAATTLQVLLKRYGGDLLKKDKT